ncbi:MAG: twin-arginine translocase subunit TatC, partial [Rhodanobacteraceae bacterium]
MSAPDTPPEHDETLPELGFMSHLIELRARLLKAILAVLIVLIALVPFAGKLY